MSIEDVADYGVVLPPASFPANFFDVLVPATTPSGREIRRSHPASSYHEVLSLIALGRVVHPTVRSLPVLRDDIRLIPITDLPPLSLGLIWRTAHRNARILALADVASRLAIAERA